MNRPPRLPELPYAGFGHEPAQPPQGFAAQNAATAAQVALDGSYEVYQETYDWPFQGDQPSSGGNIYTTKRRWRGVDVYVTPKPANTFDAGVFGIFVYGLTKGIRSLVATGRLIVTPLDFAGPPPLQPNRRPTWVASARAICERYEIATQWSQLPGPRTGLQMTVAVVASDECVDPGGSPDVVGAVSMGTALNHGGVAAKLGELPGTGTLPTRLELLHFSAINGAGAPRFLHLHDLDFPRPAGPFGYNGLTPLFAWTMGSTLADGVAKNFRYRARGNLLLVPSSTLLTTTDTSDCAVSALVR